MSNNFQLNNLDHFLKHKNADYSIFRDELNLEKASEGAQHYGISLGETTLIFILKSKDKFYAAIICGDRRLSFKKLKQALGLKK